MNILVAYNGSHESKTALNLASSYAKAFDAKMFVIHSMEGGAGEKPEDIVKSRKELERVRQVLDQDGVKNEVNQTVRGLAPGEDLIRFSEENDIDHIFAGIEKKSKTQKLILGSTAQYLILKASCPVTTIK
jgi:nucleotide-binding universal stress UspA family protein